MPNIKEKYYKIHYTLKLTVAELVASRAREKLAQYDDLVNIYCHAHWGSPHPSFRREDVWEAGTLHPMEHPEMLYLPPNLPGSTPKKPELVRNPTESDPTNLEEMGHHELIDLVKKLLVESF